MQTYYSYYGFVATGMAVLSVYFTFNGPLNCFISDFKCLVITLLFHFILSLLKF